MLTQGNRDIAVSSPLGEDVLVFRRMSAREGLSELFLYSIDVLTMRPSLDFNALLGQPMTVRLSTASSVRYFSGLVTRFSHRGSEGRYGLYRAELRPWLWFLTRNRDSRIFQERTAPEIVKSVLRERGFSDIDDRLSGHYLPWEYCVQHQESDFAFISRLMEHEGIYYYFTHQNGRHTLVLADGIASHDDLAPSSRLRFSPEKRVQESLRVVTGWTAVREVTAGVHTVDDYDFERPRADLRSTLSMPQRHALSEMEVYEYPGNMAYQPSGQRGENSQPYARSRLEEAQAVHETVEAESNVSEISAGVLFNLTHHPVGRQNREYLISAVEIALESDAYEGGGGGSAGADPFLCRLWALPGQVQFRAPRRTPWPRVWGPQTAFVAGKAGEEIWTDRFGRIKVHFPWDREGEANENSSCWIRVAQVWAGKQWGGQFLPRIGQEVIVSFLDGDPNRPIVTGTVYNGEATPPFALPEKATQSGWRSNSSKNAKGHNEFRFEDKAGREQVYIHGQKDMDVKVRATKRESMGGDRHQTVGRDKKQMVEGNHHDITWTDRYQNVDTNLSQMVGLDKHEEIGQNYALKAGLEIAVEAGLSISLKGSGGFITIGPTGVTISGNLVLINSGGSPSGLSAQVTEPDEAAYAWDGEPGKGGGAPRAKRGSRLAANRGRIAQIAAKRAATEWGAAKAKIQAEQAAAAKLQQSALAELKANNPGAEIPGLLAANAATPSSELDKLKDARDKAILSQYVYGSDPTLPDGYSVVGKGELAALGLKESSLSNKDANFRAEVFKKQGVNGPEYVVAFRGTQMTSLKDWGTNVSQAFGGESAHYSQAIALARTINEATGGNVSFTGHSLGGGLASAAAVVTGRSATTFNAAGLHPNTVANYSDAPPADVTAYYVPGEVLSGLQDNRAEILAGVAGGIAALNPFAGGFATGYIVGSEASGEPIMPQAYGERVELPVSPPADKNWIDKHNPIDKHGIDWVINGLQSAIDRP